MRFARRLGVGALIAMIPALAIFGYIAWRELRGPTPAALCDRIDELTHTASTEVLRDQCISTYAGLRDLSDATYRELAACIDHATSADDIATCR